MNNQKIVDLCGRAFRLVEEALIELQGSCLEEMKKSTCDYCDFLDWNTAHADLMEARSRLSECVWLFSGEWIL